MKLAKKHKHDLIYKAQCPDLNRDETYIGEIGRRFSERIIDHSGCDDIHKFITVHHVLHNQVLLWVIS